MSKSWKQHNQRLSRFEKRFYPKNQRFIAGIDEAGRGPWAGPVVAAAVIVKNFSFVNKIFDSKQLSFSARQKAYNEIIQKADIGIGLVPSTVIDQTNILKASLTAMHKAVLSLPAQPEFLLIDGKFGLTDSTYPFRAVIKGDQLCFSIACASIVAKVIRDQVMSYYSAVYPGFGFEYNRGYGTKSHLESIKKQGTSPIHRYSFQPIVNFCKTADISRVSAKGNAIRRAYAARETCSGKKEVYAPGGLGAGKLHNYWPARYCRGIFQEHQCRRIMHYY